MPYVEVHKKVQAGREKVLPIIKKMEDYPLFMADLKEVTVLERGDNYTITHWVSNVDGRTIQWTERDTFFDDEWRIHYQQTEGDLKKMEGEWRLTETDGGTDVMLTVDFEFGIPMIAGLLNPILKMKVRDNSENMLAAVKAKVEENA